MKLLFPDVALQDFDFNEHWLVRAVNEETKDVLFEGQGRNTDLELVLNYLSNEDEFKQLSVGELVELPYHQFVVEEDLQPTIELF
ncbi:hypothetical protein DIX60_10630 [Streptococcus iniae]|uniref:hypothetical protein n=1 Tax=Streptococcus iniae TaxID=1346 RepID=UPI0002E13816|nr:hypothetical protein [Streptococcus iniae]ESR08776.1 hypothetical protein IUSA1_10555 [Streptococcus iniae IUSA1]RLV26740.1 hypothetical protein DIX60_10630 [Streptococcus iniae]